ncbi:hypothetical protein HPB52_022156 [Rhipicephalus sanguineus]|uniref:Uncharacterized protein n=1 Tax=Rhipicephalus sanguineus TaxID=34632 RepID=A0A9D4TBP5_RHISA|nr:hypothetical protein HPB52_022156 [Rhipicephalus sanguineus]
MSGEEKSTRPLSPGSEDLPFKKTKAGSSSAEASPPQLPFSPARSPAPGTSGSHTPTGPRSTSPKSPHSRSMSPIERIVSFFKRSPPPAKPPSEGGSPKDAQAATERWVREGCISPPAAETAEEPLEASSSKEPPRQKVTFAAEESTGFDPLTDAFARRGVAYEQFSDEILKEEGINLLPPTASVEDLSSESETSQGGAAAVDPTPGCSFSRPTGPADPM